MKIQSQVVLSPRDVIVIAFLFMAFRFISFLLTFVLATTLGSRCLCSVCCCSYNFWCDYKLVGFKKGHSTFEALILIKAEVLSLLLVRIFRERV
jgi:hypothetical protein